MEHLLTMKNKKNPYIYKNSKKNRFLAKIALVLLLSLGFMSSLFLINQKQDNRQQASYNKGGVLITFKEVSTFPKNSLVSIPVYLNTQGININFLQLKININGNIKNPNIKINNKTSIKITDQKIENNQIYISLKSQEEKDGFSTYDNTELFSINFTQETDGTTTLNFDQKGTLAQTEASDENVITIGHNAIVRVGTILPIEVESISNKTIANNPEKQVDLAKNQKNYIDNKILIAVSISSSLVAIVAIFYILNTEKKERFHQSSKALT